MFNVEDQYTQLVSLTRDVTSMPISEAKLLLSKRESLRNSSSRRYDDFSGIVKDVSSGPAYEYLAKYLGPLAERS